MKNYTKAQAKIIDLVVTNLPTNADADTLKKIAGSKHVISASVQDDTTKKGANTGLVSVRLNQGETPEQVKFNFIRLGYQVQDVKN
jgi:hypothetical protein